jgi:hypothetical protein
MKNLLSNKFFWAGAILAVGTAAWYISTWNNKKWLAEQIVAKGGAENTEANWKLLESKSKDDLRRQLKQLN